MDDGSVVAWVKCTFDNTYAINLETSDITLVSGSSTDTAISRSYDYVQYSVQYVFTSVSVVSIS